MTKKKDNKDELSNERFRSNLLSIVSHELNTPLTGILNSISVLEDKYPDEKQFLPMLRRNAERLRKTIDNLLEISRVDAGAMRVRLAEIDLGNFIYQRRDLLKPELDKTGFSLQIEVEDDLPHVSADFKRLGHVFDGLVLNAIKFSHKAKKDPAGESCVFTKLEMLPAADLPVGLFSQKEKKTGLYLIVTVQSNLPSLGERPKNFEQMFEPFAPWKDVDTRVKDGLGVELAIFKEILLAHEGFIWADSDDEAQPKGWKFKFALPLLSREDELDLVINNRLHTAIGAISKMSVLLLQPAPGTSEVDHEKIRKALKRALFRASDSTFWIEDTGEYAVLMDDCDGEGASRVAERLAKAIHKEMPDLSFVWGLATGPDDGTSAIELLALARSNWRHGF